MLAAFSLCPRRVTFLFIAGSWRNRIAICIEYDLPILDDYITNGTAQIARAIGEVAQLADVVSGIFEHLFAQFRHRVERRFFARLLHLLDIAVKFLRILPFQSHSFVYS